MNFRIKRHTSGTCTFYCNTTLVQERVITNNPVSIHLYASVYSGGRAVDQFECQWDNFQITQGSFTT